MAKGTLLVRGPDGRDAAIAIGDAAMEIGRGPDCAVRTFDSELSRRHARLERRGDRLWIVALGGSTVLVNGKQVTSHALEHDDAIQCGATVMRYVEG